MGAPGAPAGPAGRQRRLAVGVYGRAVLGVYDVGVLWASNRLIWRCPADRTEALYRENLTNNHLDVGVGTGYFLDRVPFPSPSPRLGLLDASAHSLAHAARRLARYRPAIYTMDILKPIDLDAEPFDSIGLTYVLHCLPGPMEAKAVAFDNLKPLLRPGGVIFGSTVLRHAPHVPRQAVAVMNVYSATGSFDNTQDSVEGLRSALQERFVDVEVETQGAVALFRARVPGPARRRGADYDPHIRSGFHVGGSRAGQEQEAGRAASLDHARQRTLPPRR